MTSLKKAVVIGSFSVGALLLCKGKRTAGLALTTVGVAVLAAEYPKGFAVVSVFIPGYFSRAARIYSTVTQIADQFRRRDDVGAGYPLQYSPDYTD
ncbi:MAG TPA: hypothetical protein VEG30_17065 [Terriglobales bacterium]|nr:hypothetical protein [Terriglobales bacterium]